jgi:predicted site-specific integrase-resolvase
MKLSEYAKKIGVTYRTAHNHWKKGLLKGYQLPTGTIIIEIDEKQEAKEDVVVLYARVSSSENKSNLDSQLNRLRDYAAARGYKISKEVKEIGSGLNDTRPQLEKVLKSDDWNIILVEHKDRFSRFGVNYINILLEKQGKKVEIINEVTDDKADLMEDFVSLVTSFCARLYGLRQSKRKTEKIIAELKREEDH